MTHTEPSEGRRLSAAAAALQPLAGDGATFRSELAGISRQVVPHSLMPSGQNK